VTFFKAALSTLFCRAGAEGYKQQATQNCAANTRKYLDHQKPHCSDCAGAYYVAYAPDDTVTAIFSMTTPERRKSNRRAMAWIEQKLAGPLGQ
jgi:hypothetical protein